MYRTQIDGNADEGGAAVRVAVLGASGATGRLLVEELVRRGHDVVVLIRTAGPADFAGAAWVVGDARDPAALSELVAGADVVMSALGPRRGDARLHREVAPLLVAAMRAAGVRRFIGVSGAGIDAPGDRKSRRDRVISTVLQRVGGQSVEDKAVELQVWASSDLDWTLVRAPRLTNAPASGRVQHSAAESPRRTSISRADLAVFLADLTGQADYVQQAPLVATR